MKNYTIGRDEGCDIVIHDDTDQISRRHAMLRIYPFGKIEIIPMGRNMTYLNGVPLRNDKPWKVRRGDVISLAKVKSIDWKTIPDPYASYRRLFVGILCVIVILFGCIIAFPFLNIEFETQTPSVNDYESTGVTVDTYEEPAPVHDAVPDKKKENSRFKFPETKPHRQETHQNNPKTSPGDEPTAPTDQPEQQIY